jgi:ribose transport system substrate-binding protein
MSLMSRRWGIVVTPIALVALLSAGSGVAAQDEEGYRMAFLSAASENGFNQAVFQGVNDALEASGTGSTADIFDGQFNATVQFNQLQDLVAQGQYDAFIIAANDGVGLASLVEQAIGEGYKVAAVNNPIGPDLNVLEPQVEGLTTTAGSNQQESSVQQAEFAVELCADRDPCRVVLFHGNLEFPFDTVRRNAWVEVFDQYDNIQVVSELEGEYSRETALGVMQDALQRSEVDLVISAADQHIFGAEIAIDAVGADVMLLGRGAATESVEALREGRWEGSYVDLPYTQGKLAAEQLLKDLNGDMDITRSFDVVEFSSVGPIATEETLAEAPDFMGEWSG